jgi:cytochrome c-type biogenesis protein
VAAVFFVFGLHLLGWLPLPESWMPKPGQPRRGAWGALVFGLVFGVALGPCTGLVVWLPK